MAVLAPPLHDFGPIHTEQSARATLFIGNPTYVDARWTLQHVPGSPSKKRALHKAAKTVEDDPSVFLFGEMAGTMRGAKLPLASSAACLPEDWNRHEVRRVGVTTQVCVLSSLRLDRCESCPNKSDDVEVCW